MDIPAYIKVKPEDNVAVAIHDIPAGAALGEGLVTGSEIPQAHKIALLPIQKGGPIIRYGVTLGYANADIPAGAWVNEHMLTLPESPSLSQLPYGTSIVPMESLPRPKRQTWLGYKNDSGYAGTRNLLGIVTTVQMRWYDEYLRAGGVGRDANPTPGNKKGGLANIVEKAMGSIAKSGTAPIEEVLSPAQTPSKHGLIFAATPASDIVCGPCQLASGIGLQVFMTGRGTPYGLAAAPVIKVCSRNEMKEHWFDMIDLNAGLIATGEADIPQIGEELFDLILDVAGGLKEPYSDKYGFHNDICVFNPAPIT